MLSAVFNADLREFETAAGPGTIGNRVDQALEVACVHGID